MPRFTRRAILAAGKVSNLKLNTTDNLSIGAWLVLSDPFYQVYRNGSNVSAPELTPEVIRLALQVHPTILYCHGAAGTRAAPARVHHYQSFSSRLRANVLVVDYRGFGESEGVPSDAGLVEDAKTAWRWLMEQGAKPEHVMIIGHSMGTGVAAQLAISLAHEDIKPRGVALLAPFTNLATLVETYSIQGIPILQPLQSFAFGRSECLLPTSREMRTIADAKSAVELIKWLVQHEFNTLDIVKDIKVPVLLAHSQDDMDIPYHHSRTLLDQLLDPHLPSGSIALPPLGTGALTAEEYAIFVEVQKQRRTARSELVRKVEVPTFGTIEEFDGTAGKVVYVETFWGKHNEVGLQEGVQDIIASTFHLGPYEQYDTDGSVLETQVSY